MSRVVLISPGGAVLDRVLGDLAGRGVRVSALLVYPSGRAGTVGPLRGLARRGWRLLRHLALRWSARSAAARVVRTGPLNSDRMRDDLRRLRPDFAVLVGCGLVDEPTLAVPRYGMAAVHPALLPWVRGSDPIANSFRRSVPLGCSSFRVDRGIDTGPIIDRWLLRVRGDESPMELRDALMELWSTMTVDLVEQLGAGAQPVAAEQRVRYPLGIRMGPAERGAASAPLFRKFLEEWVEAVPDGIEPLRLPAEFSPPGHFGPIDGDR